MAQLFCKLSLARASRLPQGVRRKGTPICNVMNSGTGFFSDSHFAYPVRSPLERGWKLQLRFASGTGRWSRCLLTLPMARAW